MPLGHWQRRALNAFLFEQTEGNAFYLIESLRILAETLGSLERIRQAQLPAQVFSERMLLIAKRRLARLSERYQRLVQIAAVIGRQVDFELLERVGGDANYDDWLIKCVDAAIFRIQDGTWHFTHDKLREGILYTLSPEELSAQHRAVAEGIEALYPDQPDHELPPRPALVRSERANEGCTLPICLCVARHPQRRRLSCAATLRDPPAAHGAS